jgi:hypothetical protein
MSNLREDYEEFEPLRLSVHLFERYSWVGTRLTFHDPRRWKPEAGPKEPKAVIRRPLDRDPGPRNLDKERDAPLKGGEDKTIWTKKTTAGHTGGLRYRRYLVPEH